MACTRGCTGTPLCYALDLCCVQLHQDCGRGCADVLPGYSVIQVNVSGNLEVCSNVGGICTCEEVAMGTDTLVLNLNGTVTHTAVDGTVVTIDLCLLLDEVNDLSPWQTLTLSAGWVAEPGMQVPQYRCLCDGRVQFRGCMYHDDADADNAVPTSIGTIAADDGAGHTCRPPAPARFQGGSNCASIEIDAAGAITTNPSILPDTRCLDGLQYYV